MLENQNPNGIDCCSYCRVGSLSSIPIDPTVNESAPLLRRSRTRETYNHFLFLGGLLSILIVGSVVGGYLLYVEMQHDDTEDFDLVLRNYWSPFSQNITIPKLEFPIKKVLLTTTETDSCSYESDCFKILKHLREQQMSRNSSDIIYNFIIAEDGRVYEGRGWLFEPDCPRCDNRTISIAFIGNKDFPISIEQQEELEALLDYSTSNNRLERCYEILTTFQETRFLIDVVMKIKRKDKYNICI